MCTKYYWFIWPISIDTYDQGQRDIRDEANMEMSDDEDKKIEENLLPPEAFQHNDTPPETEKLKPFIGNNNNDTGASSGELKSIF